jgi:hypothetical protein
MANFHRAEMQIFIWRYAPDKMADFLPMAKNANFIYCFGAKYFVLIQ